MGVFSKSSGLDGDLINLILIAHSRSQANVEDLVLNTVVILINATQQFW